MGPGFLDSSNSRGPTRTPPDFALLKQQLQQLQNQGQGHGTMQGQNRGESQRHAGSGRQPGFELGASVPVGDRVAMLKEQQRQLEQQRLIEQRNRQKEMVRLQQEEQRRQRDEQLRRQQEMARTAKPVRM